MTTIASASKNTLLDSLMQTTTKASTTQNAQQDRFLKLLVTQMRNQDPLNPMENAEVTTQLAQISTVNGIDKLNATLKSITDGFMASQSLQASALIGRGVLSEGNSLVLENGHAVGGAVLHDAAEGMSVKIMTKQGIEMETVNLGPQSAGMLTFQWDGKTNDGKDAPDGDYIFKVDAVKAGKSVSVQPIGFARVHSVTLGDGQITLDTEGLGPLRLDQVKQILQ
ncbi:MAG TPA: flagellar hook assembly protein FlgD [Burkholderiales bacterium]|nr:flagellar hook assembly protein FlgD [Burkholderiales bacterium]